MGMHGASSKQGQKMAINQERVNAACNELSRLGEKTTLAAVREALGEGSFSTIGPLVQHWKAERKGTTQTGASGEAVTVPDAVQMTGARMLAEVWAMAEKAANERLTAERGELEAARSEMAAELEAAYSELETMREKVAEQKQAMDQLEKREKEAESKAEKSQAKIYQLQIDLAQARGEAGAYKVAIEKINQMPNQVAPKKPAPSKKQGQAIEKSNEGGESVDTKTEPLPL